MNECEKRGTGGLKPHGALLKGGIHRITIRNEAHYYPKNPKIPLKVEFKLHSNTTLWELRCLIAPQAQLLPNQMRLIRSYPLQLFQESENSRTLGELRIRQKEAFVVIKRYPPMLQANLTDQDGQLTAKAKTIFSQWFFRFCDNNGLMSHEACADFTNSCTGDSCKPHNRRIELIFAEFDSNGDGYLTLEDFLEFYKNACLTRLYVVWNNLQSYNYRNDLQCYLDLEEEKEVDMTTIPSYQLSQNEEQF